MAAAVTMVVHETNERPLKSTLAVRILGRAGQRHRHLAHALDQRIPVLGSVSSIGIASSPRALPVHSSLRAPRDAAFACTSRGAWHREASRRSWRSWAGCGAQAYEDGGESV